MKRQHSTPVGASEGSACSTSFIKHRQSSFPRVYQWWLCLLLLGFGGCLLPLDWFTLSFGSLSPANLVSNYLFSCFFISSYKSKLYSVLWSSLQSWLSTCILLLLPRCVYLYFWLCFCALTVLNSKPFPSFKAQLRGCVVHEPPFQALSLIIRIRESLHGLPSFTLQRSLDNELYYLSLVAFNLLEEEFW